MTLSQAGLSIFLIAVAFQDGAVRPTPSPPQPPPVAQRKDPPKEALPISTDSLLSEARQSLKHRDLEGARTRFDLALKRFEQRGDLKGQAEAHSGLAEVSWARGDLQGALTSFEKSLSLCQRLRVKEPRLQAQTLVNRGEVLIAVGQPEEAIGSFNEARKLVHPERDQDIRFAIASGAGLAYLDLELRDRAVFAYNQALNIAPRLVDKAISHHRLGTVYTLQEKWSEATEALKKSRDLARQAKAQAKTKDFRTEAYQIEAYALADLAHLDDLAGRDREALDGFTRARKIFEELEINLYVASTLFGTAEVLRDLQRFEEAIDSIERSIDLTEVIRSELTEADDRVGFFANRHRYYDLYIELLMEQARRKPGEGYAIQAFEASEQSKARSLLDDMAGEPGPATQGMKPKEIQSELLDQDSLLLAYSLGKNGSFLWVMDPATITVHRLPRREVIEEAASRAWSELSQGRGNAEIEGLSRMLLPAGIPSLTGKRLLVSMDGLLHRIPFTLLKGKGHQMLFLDHVITYIPSASVVVGMREKLANRPLAPKKFAGVGDPVFQITDKRLSGLGEATDPGDRGSTDALIGRLERLPFSDREVRGILRLFSDEDQTFSVFGFDANRSILDEMDRFQILHFATHHIPGDDPNSTGLVLSLFDESGRPQNGFLTAPEIYSLNLPAELVVLSACGTGLGEDVRGEGPVGLTRAFLHAGSKRVVVSLWSVKDESTAELMTRFYRGMVEHKLKPAEALQAAQKSMYGERRWRPSYRSWGSFVLQGEPR